MHKADIFFKRFNSSSYTLAHCQNTRYFSHFTVEPDVLSQRTYRSSLSVNETINSGNRDFKIIVESKSNVKHCIHLVAPTVQDKEAWISDISQCIDNIHLHTMLSPTTESIGLSLYMYSLSLQPVV